MPEILNPRVVAGLRLFSRLGSLAAVLLGGLVLLGCATGSPSMVTVLPGLATMSPVTACALVLGGASLVARRQLRPALADTTATLLLVLSAVVLAGYGVADRDVIDPAIGHRSSGSPDSLMGSTAPAAA